MEHFSPATVGLEEHLALLADAVERFAPDFVALDAVGSLHRHTHDVESASVISRDIDLLRGHGCTALVTTLSTDGDIVATEVSVSSQVDAWLQLRNVEAYGERTRILYIIKNRDSAHSNQTREFVLTSEGIRLIEVAVDHSGVLTGSRRIAHESALQRGLEREERTRARRRQQLDARIAEIDAEIAALEQRRTAEQQEARIEASDLSDERLNEAKDLHDQAIRRSEPGVGW